MPLGDPFERVGAFEIKTADQFLVVVAGVGAGSGRDRAEEDSQLTDRDQRPDRPGAFPVARISPLAGLVPRTPEEREGRVDQDHRNDEVENHQLRRQVVIDDEGPQDRLSDHPERKQDPDPGQVLPVRTTEEGEQTGRDHRDRYHAGDQTVAVLDPGVDLGGSHVLPVALGPVRAAETGSGEADPGPGEHDADQGDQRDQGNDLIELRRNRKAADAAQEAGISCWHQPQLMKRGTRPAD